MSAARLVVKAVLPTGAVALAVLGILQLRAHFVMAGGINILLALSGFVAGARWLDKSQFTPGELATLRPLVLRAIVWSIVFDLVALSVVYVSDYVDHPGTDRIADFAWLAAIVLSLIVTWVGRRSGDLTPVPSPRTGRAQSTTLVLIIIMAFAIRAIDLSGHPYPWSGDEASIGTEARRILKGEVTNFFDAGWSLQPNWSFVPTAISEIVLGENIIAVRATSVVAGTLAVVFLYLAALELFNPVIALMSAAILATLPYNVHFSRIGVSNVMDSCMSALTFWLIARAHRKDDIRWYFSAGIAAGLCLYTYAGTRLVLILSFVILVFIAFRRRGFLKTHWKHFAAFGTAMLIAIAPQAAFFMRHPDIFLGRMGQEGILFNGWLADQAKETGASMPALLFAQFRQTVLAFVASPAAGNFFNSPYPYLTVFGSLLFLLGMGFGLAFPLELNNFIVLIWFWSPVVLGGVLTLNPPANTRMLMTSPAVALLMASGAYKLLEYLQEYKVSGERLTVPILIGATAIIAWQNTKFYMGEYRTAMYFQDASGEFAMEASRMARDLGKEYQIYVVGAPRVFADFPTFAFVAPDNPRADLSAESFTSLTVVRSEKVAFFAVPENLAMMDAINQKFPQGRRGIVYRKSRPDEVLFEYYIVGH